MRREKLVLQIDGNPVVPIFRRHLERRMTLIMRRIVDENLDAAKHAADLVDRGTQRGDVREVGGLEMNPMALRRQFFHKRLGLDFLDIDEGRVRTLGCEAPDDSFANAAATTGDKHGLVGEIRINRPSRLNNSHDLFTPLAVAPTPPSLPQRLTEYVKM